MHSPKRSSLSSCILIRIFDIFSHSIFFWLIFVILTDCLNSQKLRSSFFSQLVVVPLCFQKYSLFVKMNLDVFVGKWCWMRGFCHSWGFVNWCVCLVCAIMLNCLEPVYSVSERAEVSSPCSHTPTDTHTHSHSRSSLPRLPHLSEPELWGAGLKWLQLKARGGGEKAVHSNVLGEFSSHARFCHFCRKRKTPTERGRIWRTRKGVRKHTNHFQSDPWRELPLLAVKTGGWGGGGRGALNDFQSHFGTAQSLSAVCTEHFKTYH